MADRFKQLDSESEKDAVLSLVPHSMFKVGEFMLAVTQVLASIGFDALKEKLKPRGVIPETWADWFDEGVYCEILSPVNNGWQKGKVKIKVVLEFCPDELEIPETPVSNNPEINKSESPLDDIRQMMNQDS